MIYAEIGTVSHGTLKTKELLRAFADKLESLYQANASPEVANCGPVMALVGEAREVDPETTEAGDVMFDLMDALQKYALPSAYFGAHEGDGADFGFWYVS